MSSHKNSLNIVDLSHENIEPGIGYLQLSGDLDIPGVQDIELKFTSLATSQRKSIILDLSEVTLITSEGLAMLIPIANTLRAEGKIMVLLSPNRKVEKVLKMAGVQDILPIEHNLESALNRARTN